MGRMVCGPSPITVAITPTWPWNPAAEAAMIKAALTYADQVSVISPTTVLLRDAQRLRLRTMGQQIEILRHVIPRMTAEPDEAARRLRGLALAEAALRRMPSDPSVRGTVLSQVASTTRTIVDIADDLLAETELTELAAAEAAGIVTYERLPAATSGALASQPCSDVPALSRFRRVTPSLQSVCRATPCDTEELQQAPLVSAPRCVSTNVARLAGALWLQRPDGAAPRPGLANPLPLHLVALTHSSSELATTPPDASARPDTSAVPDSASTRRVL